MALNDFPPVDIKFLFVTIGIEHEGELRLRELKKQVAMPLIISFLDRRLA